MSEISVVVVDDHPLFREGVSSTINSSSKMKVVAQGNSAFDAIELASQYLPDSILLDVSMEGGGINAVKSISENYPVIKIVMLTVSEHDHDVLGSLRYGASGYILKGVGGSELVRIIEDVYSGNSYVTPGLAARLLSDFKSSDPQVEPDNSPLDQLNKREEQILEQLSKGLSNKEIGELLGIAEKTVKHYVTNILKKLQVRNRVEAAVIANANHN